MKIYLVLWNSDEQTGVHSGWFDKQEAEAARDQAQDADVATYGDCCCWYSVYPLEMGVVPH
jgi:hypothetical protein